MLDDRELELLGEIERRLLIEDPELVRSFGTARHRRPPEHSRGTDMITTVAGLTLCVVVLMGPRLLTEAEITTHMSAGPPRVDNPVPRCPCPHEEGVLIPMSTGSRRQIR